MWFCQCNVVSAQSIKPLSPSTASRFSGQIKTRSTSSEIAKDSFKSMHRYFSAVDGKSRCLCCSNVVGDMMRHDGTFVMSAWYHIAFMANLCRVPSRRISASQALKHDWFQRQLPMPPVAPQKSNIIPKSPKSKVVQPQVHAPSATTLEGCQQQMLHQSTGTWETAIMPSLMPA